MKKSKVKIPANADPIKLADEIKKGMGNALLEDYKRLKKSFKSVLVK